MARKIIIQDEDLYSSDFTLNYVFWVSTPTDQIAPLANPTAGSVVKDATSLEIDAIRNGSVLEFVGVVTAPKNSDISVAQAKLITMHEAKQAEVNNRNAFRFYGMNWDDTNWTSEQQVGE